MTDSDLWPRIPTFSDYPKPECAYCDDKDARIAQLEEMLEEAHTALTFYADGEHMGGHSVAMSGEPYFSVPEDGHKARAALAKPKSKRCEE
jgi:hypothetical protein